MKEIVIVRWVRELLGSLNMNINFWSCEERNNFEFINIVSLLIVF